MRKSAVRVFLCLLVAASAAGASSWDDETLTRSWQDPATNLSAYLRVDLPADPNGSGYQTSTTLYVSLRWLAEAPLRFGEVERFRVRAEVRPYSSQNQIEVRLEPEVGYHRYYSDFQYVYNPNSYSNYVTFYVRHGGRIKTGAPATFDQASVHFTTPAEPLTLKWRDFAFEENGSAPTTYKFFIYEAGWLSPKLVAKGEVPRAEGELQSVSLTEGGPFTAESDAWFQVGKRYWVFLKLKREGTEWYTGDYGDAFEGVFTFKEGGSDRALTFAPAPAALRRACTRQSRFR